MAYRLTIVFGVIATLGILNYAWTQLAGSISASEGFSLVSAQTSPFASQNGSTGLSSIEFSLFSKDSIGWSHITQGYGRTSEAGLYVNGWHNGIDIAARYGAPIYSPRPGTVIATGNQDTYCPGRGFGKFVAVNDPADNIVLWYTHLGTIMVSSGQNISKGTEIGTIGITGLETGTHLHLSVFEAATFSIKNKNGCGPDADGRDISPIPYLQRFAD